MSKKVELCPFNKWQYQGLVKTIDISEQVKRYKHEQLQALKGCPVAQQNIKYAHKLIQEERIRRAFEASLNVKKK